MNRLLLLTISLFLLSASPKKEVTTIHLVGDSTCAPKLPEKRPETGWGEKFGAFFNDDVAIANYARNGRSTRTFISEGRWDSVMNNVKKGDYVFIQFGHNDQSESKPDRYTPPADFERNLVRFVNETRAKGATPVLLTPVCRRKFQNGSFIDQHGIYPGITRKVAKNLNVQLYDMHTVTMEILVKAGEEESKKLFLQCAPGECPNYPEGIEDNTHFNDYGATVVANALVNAIAQTDLPLKQLLR